MNVKNNKRRRESVEKIGRAFVQLLQEQELNTITVSRICEMTGLNRSTFYANYQDVYDLADHVRRGLEEEFSALFAEYDTAKDCFGATKMFTHIRENQLFYQTYFKLCYDESHKIYVCDPVQAEQARFGEHMQYHIEFFRSGLNAIIKMWLAGGCRETPEEMAQILTEEYRGR